VSRAESALLTASSIAAGAALVVVITLAMLELLR
jgi:hypothetical protein